MAKSSVRGQEATFGAGCFWCVEALFRRLNGVFDVEAGYSGGQIKHPTYKQVCSGKTGHVEVVRITFDPSQVSFETLLRVFWHTHDPTTRDRQGGDVGKQYRSVVFYHDDGQKQAAEKVQAETEAKALWPDPIVTAISPLVNYFKAENHHQDYYAINGNAPYCSYVIRPKLEKLEKEFEELLVG